MATTVWTVDIDGQQHKVELLHRWVTGIRRITVDGEVIHRARDWFLVTGQFRVIPVLDNRAKVMLVSTDTGYAHYLLLDNRVVSSDKQRAKGIDSEKLLAGKMLQDMRFWLELGERLGLQYMPMADAVWRFRHRLVGRINDTPVAVYISGKDSLKSVRIQPLLTVDVRHGEAAPEDVGKGIVDDPRLPDLMPGATLQPSDVTFASIKAQLLTPYSQKKQNAADVAQGIRNFVKLVVDHAPALPPDVCEECGRRTTPKMVLPSYGTPVLICQNCLDKLPEKAAEARRAYDAAPNKLGRGVLAGLGVSLLLAPVFAAVIVILNRVGAIMGMAAFFAIIKAMDRVGTKRTLLSAILAGLLSAPGMFLSVCLVAAWAAWQEGLAISPEFFAAVAEVAWTSKLLPLMAFFSGIGVAIMVYSAWAEQRKAVADYFSADVELVPESPGNQRVINASEF